MYFFPLVINQRRVHVVELFRPKKNQSTDDTDDGTQDFISEFIIKNTNTPVEVLRINYDAKFISKSGIENDLAGKGELNFSLIEVTNEDKYYLTFKYRRDGSKIAESGRTLANEKKQDFLPFQFENDRENKCIKLNWIPTAQKGLKDNSYRIFLQLDLKEWNESKNRDGDYSATSDMYECLMLFHMAKSSNVVEAVIDFGSEASQITYVYDGAVHPVGIREYLSDNFYHGNSDEIANWAQQDYEGSPNLFVSNFFLDQEDQNRKLDVIKQPFEFKRDEDGDDYLHILNDILTISGHMKQLPNIKLSEFSPHSVDFRLAYNGGNQGRFIVNRDYIYMTILSQLIHVLLIHIADTNRNKSDKKSLKLTFLVPNIYSQNRVSRLIQEATFYINEIFHDYEDSYGVYRGIEIQTFSESDAAFLGIMDDRNKKIQPNKSYLVVDSGKGTTDISVVYAGEGTGDYRGVFRTGFAGAGQVLTYAVLDTIICSITKNNISKRKELIHKIATTFDAKSKLNLFRALELLKKNMGNEDKKIYTENELIDENADAINSILNPREGRDDMLENLLSLIKKMADYNLKIEDYHGIIESSITDLCDEVIHKIKDINLNSSDDSIEFDTLILTGRAFKLALFREKFIEKVSTAFKVKNTEWAEKMAKNACINGCLNIPTGINLNSDIVGKPYLLTSNPNVGVKGSFWGSIFKPGRVRVADDDPMDFYLNGLNESNYSEARKVIINGFEYNIINSGPFDLKNTDEINIFYSGTDFWVRTKRNVYRLTQKLESPDGNELRYNTFLWRSLYPYLNKDTKENEIFVHNIKS